MNTENASQESATDIKVEKESDDEVQSEADLYADHEIKEEVVIGPVVLQEADIAANSCEDVPVVEKIKLEEKDEKTDQVEPKKEIIEDNTEEIISNVDIKNMTTVKNEEQYVLVAKKIKLEENDEDQVEPKKEIIEDNTEEIISNIDIKNTTTVKNEEQSLRKYNQTPGITCHDCGQKFSKICQLAQHIVSHEKIKQDNNFKCKECTYQTGSQVSLEQHYKLHDIDRIFASDGSKHYLLNNHPKKKLFSCSECEYVTTTKYYLEQHLRNHTREKQYSCSKCKYEFSDQSALSKHLRTHREKNLSCSECKYKCCFKYEMAIHLRTHSGDKPYSCSECEYKCARKRYLKIHLRTHTGQQ